MNVLIYQDYIHNNGALYRALCRTFGIAHVGFCDAQDIAAGALHAETQIFVMPGGADLYYGEKLNGAGNRAIRAWVENGGCYLGICAGAYYACAAIDWAKDAGADAIAAPRELAFFPGTAIGPVYDFMQGNSLESSWHGTAEIVYSDGGPPLEHKVFYEAGPVFITQRENDPAVTILARYSTLPGKPAAIVECTVGAGRALLCSPHPEQDGDSLRRRLYRHHNPFHDWEKQVAEHMAEEETLTRRLWTRLMARCVAPRRKAA